MYHVTYSMTILNDTLRGLHNVFNFASVFLKCDFSLQLYLSSHENYFRKTTKDRDLHFSPVVSTCISFQIRLFIILWLNIEPLQPISSTNMCSKLEPDISYHSIHEHQIYSLYAILSDKRTFILLILDNYALINMFCGLE